MAHHDRSLESFRMWLIEEHGLGRKSAGNAVSRGRRVERLFNQQLDDIVRTEDGLSAAIERLRREETIPERSRGGLIRALRLYARFAARHPEARTVDTAREALLDAFREWLIRERDHTPGSANTNVSRLRRVERLLGVSLTIPVPTDADLADVLATLDDHYQSYRRVQQGRYNPYADLRRTVAHFAAFQRARNDGTATSG